MKRKREYKETHGAIINVNEDLGEVTAIFSVFGNVDLGRDRIWPGAFTKTFAERGDNILALDQHRTESTTDTIAKPVLFREVAREDLPEEILSRFPEATGGAEVTLKFEPDKEKDQKSSEVFYRLKNKWISQWSFGYDALDYDFTEEVLDGKSVDVRNLRTIRLYEVSPVLWGMNPATGTTGAKADEMKPWDIFEEGGEYCIYKVDEDGSRVGDSLGCHSTRGEANDQLAALYASEEAEKEEKPEPEVTEDYIRIRVRDPDDFQDESFRTITLSEEEGIKAIMGRLSGETTLTIQAYLFDKDKWTESEAQTWVEEHSKSNKSINLSKYVESIRTAFYAQYPDNWDLGLYYHVMCVYDNRIVVEKCSDEGIQYFSIRYTMDLDEAVVFLPEWTQGSYMFIPFGATEEEYNVMANDILQNNKAGRVLSQRNADKLVAALATLLEVLETAGIEIPMYNDEEDVEKGDAVSVEISVQDESLIEKIDELIVEIKRLTAPQEEAAEDETTDLKAGPDLPPTLLLDVEKALVELETMY